MEEEQGSRGRREGRGEGESKREGEREKERRRRRADQFEPLAFLEDVVCSPEASCVTDDSARTIIPQTDSRVCQAASQHHPRNHTNVDSDSCENESVL